MRNFKDRKSFLKKKFSEQKIKKIILSDLTHNEKVKIISKKDLTLKSLFQKVGGSDSFLTQERGAVLTITVADCFPLFIFDPKKEIVGLCHAGWRGILKNIIGKTIQEAHKEFQSDPGDILVGIGPGIQECHFEIKNDIFLQFKNYPEFILKRRGKIFIDLLGIIVKQLLESGLKKANIEALKKCTYCFKDKGGYEYFSYRRAKKRKQNFQLMLAFLSQIDKN